MISADLDRSGMAYSRDVFVSETIIKKVKVCSYISSPLDRSKRLTLHPPGRPVQSRGENENAKASNQQQRGFESRLY